MLRVVLLIGLMLGSAGPTIAEPASFTVMTYNMRAGLGSAEPDRNPIEARGRKQNLKPVVAAIRSAEADVIALQEVVGESQAREIAAALRMKHVYARHGATHGNWWGLAILSRHEIISHRADGTSTGRGNTRSDLTAVIRIGDRDVTVVNVHTDKDLKDGAPIKRTLGRISSVKGPLIVLGDFNARPKSERIAPMRSRLTDVTDVATAKGASDAARHPTFMRETQPVPGARIDYIFVDRKFLDVREMRLLDRAHWPASDHVGVIATMKLKPMP
jgi:endonuclease/exonuclease/phosphatase family metal-dependent hydrolase